MLRPNNSPLQPTPKPPYRPTTSKPEYDDNGLDWNDNDDNGLDWNPFGNDDSSSGDNYDDEDYEAMFG